MNIISDEMLNRFLDNELNKEEKEIVKTAIEDSADLGRKYENLVKADNFLKNSEIEFPTSKFTEMVMNKINNQKVRVKQQKRFLFVILSVLSVIILVIVGFIFIQIIPSTGNESNQVVTEYSQNIGNYFSGIFGKKNISIFGSILSFIMLASGYFFYEFQKRSKNHFSH